MQGPGHGSGQRSEAFQFHSIPLSTPAPKKYARSVLGPRAAAAGGADNPPSRFRLCQQPGGGPHRRAIHSPVQFSSVAGNRHFFRVASSYVLELTACSSGRISYAVGGLETATQAATIVGSHHSNATPRSVAYGSIHIGIA